MKIMEVKIKDSGCIRIELWPDFAPIAVGRVTNIARLHKYDGRLIERFEPGFVIQPLFYDGLDEAVDEHIPFETATAIPFERGIVAMAATSEYTCAGQYFITLARAERLDGRFSIIGKVIGGWDTIEALEGREAVEKIREDTGFHYHQFATPVIIEHVTITEE